MGFYSIMLEGEQARKYLVDKQMKEYNDDEKEYERSEEREKHKAASSDNSEIRKHAQEVNARDAAGKYADFRLADIKADKAKSTERGASDKYFHNNDYTQSERLRTEYKKAEKESDKAEETRERAHANYSNAIHKQDDAIDAIERHMRRHPDQWEGSKRIKTRSESGIFESVEFLNERGSFKAKKEIKNSEDYARMKEIVKEYKKEKDEKKKDELRNEGTKILDKLISEAENIPSDGFFEWMARFIIRQFDNGFRFFLNAAFGISSFKATKYMTRSDFLDQLYEIKADIEKKK